VFDQLGEGFDSGLGSDLSQYLCPVIGENGLVVISSPFVVTLSSTDQTICSSC
jgi:hypothetical protein